MTSTWAEKAVSTPAWRRHENSRPVGAVHAIDTRAVEAARQFDTYSRARTAAELGISAIHRSIDATAPHTTVSTIWTGHRNTIRFAVVDDPHAAEIRPGRDGVPLISALVCSAPFLTVADGRYREHSPGTLILTRTRRCLREQLLERGSVAAVRVERDHLHVSDQTISNALASGASRSAWYANLVKATIQVIARLALDPVAPPNPAGIDRYAASILELTIRTVANAGLELGPWSPEQRRRRAEQFIERHLLDAKLDAAAVASHLGISVRQLARDLQGGPSVTVMIQTARLHYADRLLRDPAHNGMTIARVAQLCRFSSQPLFSRRYKSFFGVTPKEAHALAAISEDPPHVGDLVSG
jgi:AraC-like DNA-binding protein